MSRPPEIALMWALVSMSANSSAAAEPFQIPHRYHYVRSMNRQRQREFFVLELPNFNTEMRKAIDAVDSGDRRSSR